MALWPAVLVWVYIQHTYIHMSIIRCIFQGSQKYYFNGQNLETLMTTNVWKSKYVYVSTIKWDRHLIHITAWMNLKGILNHESKYQEITIISSVWNTKTSNKLYNFHKHRSQVWQQIKCLFPLSHVTIQNKNWQRWKFQRLVEPGPHKY